MPRARLASLERDRLVVQSGMNPGILPFSGKITRLTSGQREPPDSVFCGAFGDRTTAENRFIREKGIVLVLISQINY